MPLRPIILLTFLAGGLAAQEPQVPTAPVVAPADDGYTLNSGTKVPLSLINSVSTKHSIEGDRVYLETAFPILANGRIVIPVGSWVAGTVTEVKRPGRVKGRGELYIRFDTLTLPNGVTRDLLRSRMDGMDASTAGELDRAEGKIRSEGKDTEGGIRTVSETTGIGAAVGATVGSAAGHTLAGLGAGTVAGLAGGLIYVLASRGPDAVIGKGSTVEMVLDRSIAFNANDLDFSNAPPRKGSQ